jgi:spore coat polysaccharide biosynthesis predicted glycosyltransferase SpsG
VTSEKTLILRCSIDKNLGSGHFKRILSIAKHMRRRVISDINLIVTLSGDPILDYVRKEAAGFNLYLTNNDNASLLVCQNIRSKSQNEIIYIADLLEEGYSEQWIRQIKIYVDRLVLITDTEGSMGWSADCIINGNPLCDRANLNPNAKYFLGIEHFIMSIDARGCANGDGERPSEQAQIGVLTVGGTDHNDIIFDLVDSLSGVALEYEWHIATTTMTGYHDRLMAKLRGAKFKWQVHTDLDSLFPLFSVASFAITAGGNTLFERITCLVPGITVNQLDRQNRISQYFEDIGVNKNYGYWYDCSSDYLRRRLNDDLQSEMLSKMQIEKMSQLKIGLGLQTVEDFILKSNPGGK